MDPNSPAYLNQWRAQVQFEKVCREPFEKSQAVMILGGVGLLFIVAGIIYWLLPHWLIWRNQLTTFMAEDDPQIATCLAELCHEAQLSSIPTFLQNPLNLGSGGLAFGRIGRYYIVLNGGLITQFYTDLPRFRAVVRHELAHLKNDDVDKTYFAVAVGLAFTAVALIPLAFSLIDDVFKGELSLGIGLAWRAFVLAGFIYLMLSAVLRTREVYADVRASVWDGPGGALRRILNPSSRPRGRRWLAMLSLHPNLTRRRQVLDETHHLFRLTIWDALSTGIAATIAFPDLNVVFGLWLDTQYENLAPLGAGLLFAPLAVGVVGMGAWRSVFGLRAQGEPLRGFGRLGLGLGAGMIIGLLLSLRSAVPGVVGPTSFIDQVASLTFNVFWIAGLLISLFLFLRWVASGASVWVETVSSHQALRPTYLFGLLVAGVLLAIWLGSLYLLWSFGYEGVTYIIANVGLFSTLDSIISSPLTLGMLISLWAYPLAAWFWHKRRVAVNEAYLEPGAPLLTLKPQWPLRPGLASVAGVAAALVCIGLMAVIRIILHFSVPESIRLTADWASGFRISQIALAILMQLGVAALITVWVRRLGWAHGLMAAFVTGDLITLGYIGLIELGDCLPVFSLGVPDSCADIFDLSLTWLVFGFIVNWGALLSLPVALIAWMGASRWNSGWPLWVSWKTP